jgi:hypothetical protein
MYESRSNIEELYVMGHRLRIFLKALPRHPEYGSTDPAIASKRAKSRQALDWIKKRLDVVALRIDEEQINRYVLNDIAINAQQQHQQHANDDELSNMVNISIEHDEQRLSNETQWENFDGTSTWTPSAKSQEVLLDWERCLDVSFDSSEIEGPSESSLEYFDCYGDGRIAVAGGSPTYPLATFARTLDDEESAFLRKCANEQVDYESDPDVPNSWAPASVTMHDKVPRTDRTIFGSIGNDNSSLGMSDLSGPLQKASSHPPRRTRTQTLREITVDDEHPDDESASTMASPSNDSQHVSPGKENYQLHPTQYEDISYRRRVRFNDQQNQFQFYVPNEYDNHEERSQTSTDDECDI